jgi:mono/diheme cytochrome c family protein
MSLHCNRRLGKILGAALAALLIGAGLTPRADATNVVRVCVDEASPTATLDERVARAAMTTQGDEIQAVPFTGYGKGGDGFPTSRFAKLAQSDCELIMGFPIDLSAPNLPPNVEATSAYASTGFVLVERASANPKPIPALPKGSEVGIAELDTFAGLLYGMHPNMVMHVYESDSQMIEDLMAHRIAAGLAWQPLVEAYEAGHPRSRSLALQPLSEKHMTWNLVALYASESQGTANTFNQGLFELAAHGQLDRLIKPYLKAEPPGASTGPRAGFRDAIAWNSDAGALIRTADPASTGKPKQKRPSRPPALYTAEQAEKGALAYYQNCAMCHGPSLDGQPAGFSGPALKGANFADPSYDFHVKDIFNFVAKLMPAATPGSLTPEQDVQVMAFLLQQNGYPAGSRELEYHEAETSMVPMRYYAK